jgi:AcrR family transcriptional regulator
MALSPPRPEHAPATAAGPPTTDGEQESAVRRAPFSDNPRVGARGQRTQQRILDAALQVFGEQGYHQSGIAHITSVAGCSRASFYQYFASKEDVFRHLTGQVARQLGASTESLGPVVTDADGWRVVRAWVGRYADTYERYEPVFDAFPAAAETDDAVAPGAARVAERNVARFRAKLATTDLPARSLDPVVGLLLACVTRVLETARILRSAAPDAYPTERIEDAVAGVVHRTLFGLRAGVNDHPPAGPRPPALAFGRAMRDAVERTDAAPERTAAGRRTLTALEEAGRDVFVARGYHGTRIDDVVAAAGVSHGAFYRYFTGKDHLAYVLAVRAIRHVSSALTEFPETADGVPDRATLRRWLRRYNATQATEAAMIRVWADAAHQDASLRRDSAAALDWGRREMARVLRPRGFGDADIDAVIMLALLSVFGTRPRPAVTTDAAVHVIERGLLGR